ncbi:uncharacterized protein PAE49_019120 [Odontesthes bonariensis]
MASLAESRTSEPPHRPHHEGEVCLGEKLLDQLTNAVKKPPHCCPQCGKSFTHSGNFQYHLRIHSGEKPHTCNQCQRRFRNVGNLRRHQSIHTGERPYTCDVCKNSFRLSEHLKRHQHIHTRGALYHKVKKDPGIMTRFKEPLAHWRKATNL